MRVRVWERERERERTGNPGESILFKSAFSVFVLLSSWTLGISRSYS